MAIRSVHSVHVFCRPAQVHRVEEHWRERVAALEADLQDKTKKMDDMKTT